MIEYIGACRRIYSSSAGIGYSSIVCFLHVLFYLWPNNILVGGACSQAAIVCLDIGQSDLCDFRSHINELSFLSHKKSAEREFEGEGQIDTGQPES